MHIVFLLEEPSAQKAIEGFVGQIVPANVTFNYIVFKGKKDLLRKLRERLLGYRKWIPSNHKIVVLIDEDRQDCKGLKQFMEAAAIEAGFVTKSTSTDGTFQVLNRIAVEEIEAWYFGDTNALTQAFPALSTTIGQKAAFRNPDSIGGGTWEALERELKKVGYYPAGLPKIEVAKTISTKMNPEVNQSPSFRAFRDGLLALITPPP